MKAARAISADSPCQYAELLHPLNSIFRPGQWYRV